MSTQDSKEELAFPIALTPARFQFCLSRLVALLTPVGKEIEAKTEFPTDIVTIVCSYFARTKTYYGAHLNVEVMGEIPNPFLLFRERKSYSAASNAALSNFRCMVKNRLDNEPEQQRSVFCFGNHIYTDRLSGTRFDCKLFLQRLPSQGDVKIERVYNSKCIFHNRVAKTRQPGNWRCACLFLVSIIRPSDELSGILDLFNTCINVHFFRGEILLIK